MERKNIYLGDKQLEIINKVAGGNTSHYIRELINIDLKNIKIEKVPGGVRVIYYGKVIDSAQCSTPEECIIIMEQFENQYKI